MEKSEFRELTQQARRASLLSYFQKSGYTVERKGSEYYIKEVPGLCIKPETNQWYHHYTGVGSGNSIDCLTKVLGIDFKQAVLELTGQEITQGHSAGKPKSERTQTAIPPKQQTAATQKRKLTMPEPAENNNRLKAYMCQTRQIPVEIVDKLINAGLLYQGMSETHTVINGQPKTYRNANAVFVHRDAAGQIVGGELQGLNSNKRFKGIAAGTGDSAFMFTPVPARDGKIRRAYIFESAIDLMSFYKFCDKRKLEGAVLVSMAGLKPSIPKKLQEEGVQIISCVDGDDAGRRFEQENGFVRSPSVKAHLEDQGFKDWNELLVFKTQHPDAHLERKQEEPLVREMEKPIPAMTMTRR